MGLKQRIVERGKQALLQPSVLRWVTDDRVMKATEGLMDARTRVKDAWKVLLNGNELPNVDPALDENIADQEDAWAHNALGSVHLFARRFSDALAEFETALRLNPNFAVAQGYYGLTLGYCGRWRDADEAGQLEVVPGQGRRGRLAQEIRLLVLDRVEAVLPD